VVETSGDKTVSIQALIGAAEYRPLLVAFFKADGDGLQQLTEAIS
jgi:hypothetical protein